MHLNLRSSHGVAISDLLNHCTLKERKGAITLARSQYLPNPEIDIVLFAKTRDFIKHLLVNPTLVDDPHYNFSELGEAIVHCVTSPILSGYIISLALCQSYSEEQLDEERTASFHKELSATQTRRLPSGWNWDYILGNTNAPNSYVHQEFPSLSILHHRFRSSLSRFRRKISQKTILPHYTTRGISKDSADYLMLRRKTAIVKHGHTRTFHRDLDFLNVTSKDVIHHYMRTGDWIRGRVQMKQRWYPSGLNPRTYFSWGGYEIQASTYLRDFFNDVADQFEPSHRHLRVQPNWLSTDKPGDFFFFYDLTSFTSWFHEQVPFLRALATYFEGVTFDIVIEGISLQTVSVSDMIDGYIRWVNDFPGFTISERLVGSECVYAHHDLHHLTAGFLGVPGNLITCTLPHGLAMSTGLHNMHHLQVPGDDVGCKVSSFLEMSDKATQAKTLGVLQMDKVYNSLQASVYLKRGVRIRDGQVNLTDMLIYPLLSLIVHPQNAKHVNYIRKVYRIPEFKTIIPRACSILVTFMRDLWKLSQGHLSDLEAELIVDLLTSIHRELRLPLGGILQGRYLGCEEVEEEPFGSISLKFPVEGNYLRKNPDQLFANEYVELYTIREMDESTITESIAGALQPGSIITVKSSRAWRFLEDMGYLRKIQRTSGDTRTFHNLAAKEAYLRFIKPAYSTFRVDEEIKGSQLMSLGLAESYEGAEFNDVILKKNPFWEDDFVVAAWRFRYTDLDKPILGPDVSLDYGEAVDDSELFYPYYSDRGPPIDFDVDSFIEMFK